MQPLPSAVRANDSSLVWGWIVLFLGLVLALVPGLGFAVWLVGVPLGLVALVLSIVAMTKGKTLGGVFLMLATLIAAPVAYLLLPLISWAIGGAE